MKKSVLILLLAILISSIAEAQVVSINTALNIAQNTILEQFSKIDSGNKYEIKSWITESYENKTIYYVFNLSPQGFIIISADRSASPVLAFSNESNYETDENPAVQFWLDTYKKQINYNV